MYKICSKKIGQVLLNIDFMIKKPLLAPRFKRMTFRLKSSCKGKYLPSLRKITWLPVVEVTKTTTVLIESIQQTRFF